MLLCLPMVKRTFWQAMLREALKEKTVVWLSGVRRAGKTMLAQSIGESEYFDCELPRVRRQMEDPEAFLKSLSGKTIILDEVHRLQNPSQLLKIAADHFRDVRIVATGSSTLGASRKFRDTLAGRKRNVWLTPMMSDDLQDFGNERIDRRFLHGGLPSFFLSPAPPEKDFQEWIDAYWAKDIQELFRLERRDSFQRFSELLLMQSGGMFEATRFARPCEVSRPTITNYLKVLEAPSLAHLIRPFSPHNPTEIVSAPKVYGFDTGFVCYHRGWLTLRMEDRGILWEHYVLNELHAHLQTREIRYWRDKQGHEIDFILPQHGKQPCIAIECKWQAKNFDERTVHAFLHHYPQAEIILVAQDVDRPYTAKVAGATIRIVGLPALIQLITS